MGLIYLYLNLKLLLLLIGKIYIIYIRSAANDDDDDDDGGEARNCMIAPFHIENFKHKFFHIYHMKFLTNLYANNAQ